MIFRLQSPAAGRMLAVAFALSWTAAAQMPTARPLYEHPAVGSWFGKAVQLCSPPEASCFKVALFMTPTLYPNGEFLGNDSLALGGPPFGPHTTAHGKWVPTSGTDIIADYVFMLPASVPTSVTGLRFRWQASTIRWDTMQGYVNIFFGPEIPMVWQNLTANQFPDLPPETAPMLTPPVRFVTDPAQCPSGPPACPLVFKFTIKRVTP